MLKKLSIYLGFLIYSIVQSLIIFSQIPKDKFLYIGDQFIRFSLEETYRNAFYIRKMENLGVFNAWQLTVQTPDILYYITTYNLGLDIRSSEFILFTLILFITLFLSFLGFSNLQKLFFSERNLGLVFAVTVWYSMNPYLMVMWHGAIYNFGSSLTYSLAPLILYYFHISLVDQKAVRERLICALLMFVSSFTFWMFAAVIFFLMIYTICYLFVNRNLIVSSIANLVKLGAIYVPLCAMIIYPILHEYFNNKSDVNGTFYATFGQIKGSILYQALMYFSWGIYNVWTPRSLYPPVISNFYFSPFYIISTLGLYALLIYSIYIIYKQNNVKNITAFIHSNYYPFIFILIFGISIFLAKGKEPPFGWIFLFLYDNVPFFSVFRSSDHRFGFPAVLALSVLFVILLPKIKNVKTAIVTLIVLTIVQNYVFFNSSLIIGQNLENKFYDRIVGIPETYNEIANYLDSDPETSYVFSYPSVEFGTFNLENNDVHIGQDMLPKISSKNFAYIPVTSGMYIPTAEILVMSIVNKNLELMQLLPIKYLLVRRDVTCADCPELDESNFKNSATRVFQNSMFDLYKLNNHSPLIKSSNPIKYSAINPTRLDVLVENIESETYINLMQSYNKSWDIYLQKYSETCSDPMVLTEFASECASDTKPINLSDFLSPGEKHIATRIYAQDLEHMNSWRVDANNIINTVDNTYYRKNEDGTYNLRFTIFYTPQQNYMRSMAVTIISILIALGALGILELKRIRSN